MAHKAENPQRIFIGRTGASEMHQECVTGAPELRAGAPTSSSGALRHLTINTAL